MRFFLFLAAFALVYICFFEEIATVGLYVSSKVLHLDLNKLVDTPSVKNPVKKASHPNLGIKVLRDVNKYRREHGVKPLRYSATCEAAAKIQVQYNSEVDEYGHENPTYASPLDRLRFVKHHFAPVTYFWGENALRYTLSRDLSHDAAWHVFDRYHHSPEHDKIMLGANVTRFGTASVLDAEGHLYNVEVFAN